MTLLSWNLHGLNQVPKLVTVRDVVNSHRLQIVCLEETKMEQCTEELDRKCSGFQDVDVVFRRVVGRNSGVLEPSHLERVTLRSWGTLSHYVDG